MCIFSEAHLFPARQIMVFAMERSVKEPWTSKGLDFLTTRAIDVGEVHPSNMDASFYNIHDYDNI